MRYLAEALALQIPRERRTELLRRITVVARGPEHAAALRGLSVAIDLPVPEPNTWRETLTLLGPQRPRLWRVLGEAVPLSSQGERPWCDSRTEQATIQRRDEDNTLLWQFAHS